MLRLRNFSLVLCLLVCFTSIASADPLSPIDMTVVDNPDPVASGSQITYTISMLNNGGAKVDNVVWTDQLNGVGGIGVPPQLQITSTRGPCTQTTTKVTCTTPQIEGRGTWTITIRGIVTAANGTVINNTATVAGTKSAQNFNSTVTATTLVSGGTATPKPDLTINKNGPSVVGLGSPMTYTLTVNNIGTANASNVRVMDTVPAGLTAISATGTSLFVCGVVGQTVTCDGGAVNQGSNATITIEATSPAVAGTITNTAVVDPNDTIVESNDLNNTSALVNTSVEATAPPPVLNLTITIDDNKDPVVPGEQITFTAFVTNPTTQRADDVEIVMGTQGLIASGIIANQVIVSGTVGNNGGCFVTASETRCRARTLNAAGTITMTVTGNVIASAGSTMLTTAAVSGNLKNTGFTKQDIEITTVKPEVDLTITKSDTPDPVCASSWPGAAPASPPLLAPPVCLGGLKYTFVLGNSGIKPATGVLIRDPLPAGTVLDGFTVPPGSGFVCGVDGSNVFTCSGGTVPPETILTITATLVAPPGTGTINNTVTIDPNNSIFEADETNNVATQSTLVVTGIDLTVLKTDKFDPIATSGTQTYTITVDNIGTQNATNIRVRDTLPADTKFRDVISDHGFTCSHSNGVVECAGGSLLGTAAEFYPPFGAPGNDKATITIRIFAQPIIGTMHNEVRVDPLNEIAEANEANNIEIEDTVVGNGGAAQSAFNQFTIAKEQVSPANDVARNAKVTYKITVTNDGTDPATGVTVRDFLPAGSRYIEATGTNHFNCSQVGGHIDCVGGELAALGGSATITVTAFAPDTPGSYTNQAIVDPDNTKPEGNEFDNQASVPTIVKNAGNGAFYELSILKTQTSPTPGNTARNAIITWKIVATNSGSDPVTNVTMRDMLPAGSRYIQATALSDNQFLCSHTGGIVDCLGGRLASGGTAEFEIKAFAPDTPGVYTNQALIDPNNTIPEGDEENNRSNFDTTVANGGDGAFNDLTITKDGPDNAEPSKTIVYVLNVNNGGASAAQNVSVRDVLPPGMTFISAFDSGAGAAFLCSHSAGVVTCTGATITAGGGRSISITVKTPAATGVDITNVASVDPDNTVPEGNESNNNAFKTTHLKAPLNLKIEKSGPTTATQSTVTDYTLTITNEKVSAAGDNAIGVLVHDALPVGLLPLAVDAGTSGWNCEVLQNPVNVVSCLGNMAPGEVITIKITVFITAESGRSLDNVACVDPDNTIVEDNEFDNCSEVSTLIVPDQPKKPDLLVAKQVDKLSTTPGDDLEYKITVSNVGTAKAKGPLTVTDGLPSQLTFSTVTATNGWTCTHVGNDVTCNDEVLSATESKGLEVGESTQITILAHVKESATTAIINSAHANTADVECTGSDTCLPEDETANNDSTVTSSIGSSGFDLAIGAVTDAPDPVAPGQGLKYTITALNAGTAAANGVVIRLNLPATGTTHISTSASNGFTCDTSAAPLVNCTGNLPGSGTTTITVSLVVNTAAPLPASASLTATIDPDLVFAETDEGNNTETEVTTISGTSCSACVDLVAVMLSASPEPVTAGGDVTYTFLVANVGDSPSDLLPTETLLKLTAEGIGATPGFTGVTITSDDPTLFPCTTQPLAPPAITVATFGTCTGNLIPGQGVKITFKVFGVTGTGIKVTGAADPDDEQVEFLNDNNTAVQTVAIVP